MSLSVLDGVDVVVLAGGLGSRVRSLLGDTPKVLAPIHGRTFLDYLLDQLKGLGAERVLLSTGFLADKVEAHLKKHPPTLRVEMVIEPEPLGTGGALRLVIPHLHSRRVLVMNGDTWLDTDYLAFMNSHKKSQKMGSILCVRNNDVSRYGSIAIDKNGAILEFIEKGHAKGQGIISGGVYIFEQQALDAIHQGQGSSLEKDFLSLREPGYLHGYVSEKATFIDIGTPDTLKSAECVIPKSKKQEFRKNE